jgi:hypothetical protein
MRRESTGQYTTLPEGEPMPWIQEYHYLDGSITITNQERTNGGTAAYNLGVTPPGHGDGHSAALPTGCAARWPPECRSSVRRAVFGEAQNSRDK